MAVVLKIIIDVLSCNAGDIMDFIKDEGVSTLLDIKYFYY